MKTKLKHISLKTVVDRIDELSHETNILEQKLQKRVKISMSRGTINTPNEQGFARYTGRRIADNSKRINELSRLLK